MQRLKAANAELRRKLESQTQRLELAIQQQAHATPLTPGSPLPLPPLSPHLLHPTVPRLQLPASLFPQSPLHNSVRVRNGAHPGPVSPFAYLSHIPEVASDGSIEQQEKQLTQPQLEGGYFQQPQGKAEPSQHQTGRLQQPLQGSGQPDAKHIWQEPQRAPTCVQSAPVTPQQVAQPAGRAVRGECCILRRQTGVKLVASSSVF